MNPILEVTEHNSVVEEEYVYVVDMVQIFHLVKTIID
jgi:hypothetical protein